MKDFTVEKHTNGINFLDHIASSTLEDWMNLNMINVDFETNLYRIFSLKYFIELLTSRTNTLVKLQKWDDPYENSLFKVQWHTWLNNQEVEVGTEKLGEEWYGQCWTTREAECDGLWRVYTDNKRESAVRIKSNAYKVFKPLFSIGGRSQLCPNTLKYFIGKVNYTSRGQLEMDIDSSKLTAQTNIPQAMMQMRKREEFEYEQEVRILANVKDDENPLAKNGLYKYSIDVDDFIDEVTVDPWCSDENFKKLQNQLIDLGVSCPIVKSQLYTPININRTIK